MIGLSLSMALVALVKMNICVMELNLSPVCTFVESLAFAIFAFLTKVHGMASEPREAGC